jgi:hypothetical protein
MSGLHPIPADVGRLSGAAMCLHSAQYLHSRRHSQPYKVGCLAAPVAPHNTADEHHAMLKGDLSRGNQPSVANLKFLPLWRPTLRRNFKFKATLES